jgi:phage shock protein C
MMCANCQKDIADGSNFCYNCGAKQGGAQPAAAQPTHVRRLVRSTNDRKIAGVCAGIADYFDIDPTIVRIIWLLATLIPGPNIIAYLVLWLALPEGPTRVISKSAPSY